jgi:hypothetical protein
VIKYAMRMDGVISTCEVREMNIQGITNFSSNDGAKNTKISWALFKCRTGWVGAFSI